MFSMRTFIKWDFALEYAAMAMPLLLPIAIAVTEATKMRILNMMNRWISFVRWYSNGMISNAIGIVRLRMSSGPCVTRRTYDRRLTWLHSNTFFDDLIRRFVIQWSFHSSFAFSESLSGISQGLRIVCGFCRFCDDHCPTHKQLVAFLECLFNSQRRIFTAGRFVNRGILIRSQFCKCSLFVRPKAKFFLSLNLLTAVFNDLHQNKSN